MRTGVALVLLSVFLGGACRSAAVSGDAGVSDLCAASEASAISTRGCNGDYTGSYGGEVCIVTAEEPCGPNARCVALDGRGVGVCARRSCTPTLDAEGHPYFVSGFEQCEAGHRCVAREEGSGDCVRDCVEASDCEPGAVCGSLGLCTVAPLGDCTDGSDLFTGGDCNRCAEERCCEQIALCQADPDCVEYSQCLRDCDNPTEFYPGVCGHGCNGNARGRAIYNMLSSCMTSSCWDGSPQQDDSLPDTPRRWCHSWCSGEFMCPPVGECQIAASTYTDCGTGEIRCQSVPANNVACEGGVCVEGTCVSCPRAGEDCTRSGQCDRREYTCDENGDEICAATLYSVPDGTACDGSSGQGSCRRGVCVITGAPIPDAGTGGADGGTGPRECAEFQGPDRCVEAVWGYDASDGNCNDGPSTGVRGTNNCSRRVYCTVCAVGGACKHGYLNPHQVYGWGMWFNDWWWCGQEETRIICVDAADAECVALAEAWTI